MFDLLTKAVRMTANVATLPLSVAADVVTLGGELNDRRSSYTGSKLSRVAKDAERIVEQVAG